MPLFLLFLRTVVCVALDRKGEVQFSLVQFTWRWYLCARKSPYALHPVSQKFPQRCLWNDLSVRLSDDGPVSSFQGRSSSGFSFHASLLQAIDGVMSLALCPQVVCLKLLNTFRSAPPTEVRCKQQGNLQAACCRNAVAGLMTQSAPPRGIRERGVRAVGAWQLELWRTYALQGGACCRQKHIFLVNTSPQSRRAVLYEIVPPWDDATV